MQNHLKNKKSYSENVILVGDPSRATLIAKKFLKNAVLVNTNRGLLAYNGEYKNSEVTIQTTGMGCPSTAIVMEELINLKVKRFIRLGTTCLLERNIESSKNSLIVVNKAFSLSNTHDIYSKNKEHQYSPSSELFYTAIKVAKKEKITIKKKNIVTTDNFYNIKMPEDFKKWQKLDISAIDMETSIIFDIANYYKKEAISILSPCESLLLKNDVIKHKKNSNYNNSKSVKEMIQLGLEIITKLEIIS